MQVATTSPSNPINFSKLPGTGGQQGQTDTARGHSSLLVTEVSNTQAGHLSSYRVEVRHIQSSQHTAARHSSHCSTPWPSDPRPGWLRELSEGSFCLPKSGPGVLNVAKVTPLRVPMAVPTGHVPSHNPSGSAPFFFFFFFL